MNEPRPAPKANAGGLAYALLAYGSWGLLPLFGSCCTASIRWSSSRRGSSQRRRFCGEAFTAVHLRGFGFIWAAVALFSVESWLHTRRAAGERGL